MAHVVFEAGKMLTGTKLQHIMHVHTHTLAWAGASHSDVNETLKPEIETRPRLLAFSMRRDRNRDHPWFSRDPDFYLSVWDDTDTFHSQISRRPGRDRDLSTKSTSWDRLETEITSPACQSRIVDVIGERRDDEITHNEERRDERAIWRQRSNYY